VLGGVDRGYAATDAQLTVTTLLAALPSERDRRIVELRFIDGCTQTQIAAQVGVSQVQVSRLLRSSLERMRRSVPTGDTAALTV
jgi:RNA polymerase sigma-B factor